MLGDKLKKMFSKKEENDNINENKEEATGIREIINGDGTGNDKRKIENLVFFVVLLIITIVIINFIWNGKKETNNDKTTNDTTKQLASTTKESASGMIQSANSTEANTESLENKLKNILSKIQGVGNVEVCINYSESSEVVAMYNENSTTSTTEEADDTGGTRRIEETDTQKEVIFQEDDGTKTPITAKVVNPKIEGAIITAQGANNAGVKNNIVQAVEAVTGLATHKIQVFEMSN